MAFELISDFQPTGDQSEAIKQLLEGLKKKELKHKRYMEKMCCHYYKMDYQRLL